MAESPVSEPQTAHQPHAHPPAREDRAHGLPPHPGQSQDRGQGRRSPAPAAQRLPASRMPVGVEQALGSHTVTAREILEFGRTWDPQYFHVDEAAAAESDFGGLIASGVHTLAVYQRLSVQAVLDRYDIVAGREFTRLRFLRPVRPGDTLSGTMMVDSVGEPRNGRALGTAAGTLVNQDDKVVLDVAIEFVVRAARS